MTTVEAPTFAHPSEAEFASILDFHFVRWEYEPETFVLERSASGDVRMAFTPDFYLPDHDVFIELTTMRQALVTKKNRKLRLLREQRPDLDVRILYRHDLEMITRKFAD